jgi:crotonobetainyl-CoA:carnitine CoA-transferase CaiB-like acyl-CoA transferase
LGEHTHEVLQEAGFSADQIKAFEQDGAFSVEQ